jgi:hypothetical protein
MSNFTRRGSGRGSGTASQRGSGSGSGEGGGRSLDASALQSDIARRFNLPGAAVKRVKYLAAGAAAAAAAGAGAVRSARHGHSHAHTHAASAAGSRAREQQQCPSCAQVVSVGDTTCPNCGIFFRSIRAFEPTLAESRGLVAPAHAPVVVVSAQRWAEIEARPWERQEADCPICMEGFALGHEVLLSCSHMFHRCYAVCIRLL